MNVQALPISALGRPGFAAYVGIFAEHPVVSHGSRERATQPPVMAENFYLTATVCTCSSLEEDKSLLIKVKARGKSLGKRHTNLCLRQIEGTAADVFGRKRAFRVHN